ncbi:ArsR/SmtB family transcription factor [Serratia aquatilis]|uniref:ArsR/SmtB family transcription factor n=1 Tax=Serratia aquatilis TaxID=1737515 RepID=A0ABV6EID3_9GAMM
MIFTKLTESQRFFDLVFFCIKIKIHFLGLKLGNICMNNVVIRDFPLVLTAVFKALSDPTRLNIVQELFNDEANSERHCSSFDCLTKFSRATRSHHFKVLREAGLVSLIDKGNISLAQLRRDEIEKMYPGLLNILVRHLK